MDVARATDGVFERGDAGRFTGEVWLRGTVTASDTTNIGVVHFSPAARTHWHRHPGGQFLYCVTGRGRVRTRGERGHALEAGTLYAPMLHASTPITNHNVRNMPDVRKLFLRERSARLLG